jgi:tetratricopeptide (TPR) repeat protein
VFVLAASFCATEAAAAGVVVYGQVWAGDSPFSTWKVELVHLADGESWHTDLWWNGAFEFRGVPMGEHRLRLVDAKGHVVHDEAVSVRRDGETLSIRLRREEAPPAGRGETISVQQLTHKSPRKALDELKNGRAALEKRQFARAVGHLESAVAVDPASPDAHNDLGVAYFELQQYQKSVEHFRRASDLAPTHDRANDNLCLALLKSGRYAEAGQVASGILKRGGGSVMAHYAAAIGLIDGGGNLDAALRHLRRVEAQMPKARLLTIRILADSGRRADAARELEAYLHSPEADSKRPELEAWLAELRR